MATATIAELDRLVQTAIQYHHAGKLASAEPIYRQVLERDPDHADAMALLGLIAHQTGNQDAAIELIERSLEFAPAVPWPHNNLGEAYRAAARIDDAIERYRTAIEIKPDYADAWNNLGIALAAKGQLSQAEEAYRTATHHNPRSAQAHANLGDLLDQTGRPNEAIAAWQQAVVSNPNYAKAHHNLGVAFGDQGDYATALRHSTRAVELEPDHADAHFNLGVIHLLNGDFLRGFEQYEWRQRCAGFAATHARFAAPMWDGSPLEGKTILLHAEQGLGDALQFARYMPIVAARGGRVVLQCQPELVRLLQSAGGASHIVGRGEPVPQHDVHCPLLSLPRIFRTEVDTVPVRVPYLSVDHATLNMWRSRIRPSAKLKVGLCWQGSREHKNDKNRSIPPALLTSLADVQDVEWYCLQKRTSLALPSPDITMFDLMPDAHDFDDTAAIVSQMNLVITVDTSVAHLAGALGKAVWTLLPFAPDWRWMLRREDTPWYPTMTLLRQPTKGNWKHVMDRARAKLATVVEEFLIRAKAG